MPTPPDMMHAKKKELMSNAMKRTTEWISSQDIPSDVTINVRGVSFSLHKFPLMSKSGYMRKLMSNFKESDHNHIIEINDIPENYAIGNLIARTEAYINEVGLKSLTSAVSILQSSETLLPISENVKLVTRCVDSIAFIVMKECEFSMSASGGCSSDGLDSSSSSFCHLKVVDWWAEDLIVLKIHTFQRVLLAMISRGFNKCAFGPILTLYAQKCLQDLEILPIGKNKSDPNQENEKRVVLETIVSLLPREKNAVSVNFLSMLLRSSIHLETTMACRLDLEKRIGLQLEQAKIRKLMESYFAEIASDCNFSVSKFVNLVECLPKQEWGIEDGIYRAIDIYLKAHPLLGDTERKKLCNLINFQKLTQETLAHAARNDRLSAETVVQVLYHEQQQLKDKVDDAGSGVLNPLPDDLSSLEKENQDLKFELLKVKMKLKEMKISHCDKSPLIRRSFMNTISKRLVKFTPFLRADHGVSPSVTKSTNKLSKDRRHSIS
ncbi:unnamed protein product [Lactuca virosa]|uniref:NPH3 domain-containing protein n=1 Tax=Lactuca virosa TaxID=75947 RepID=A0AAU9LFX9_9ASTR|nr:unnamed protein product [Lactuca virosa]